ncbi:SUN domain-containing protein 1-like [Periplaneta americana]|uniref:SUN domain-containing protein 1-like n=1 Tax=Periplaneta americana TaxID=6978 RepID=UPI0037E80026
MDIWILLEARHTLQFVFTQRFVLFMAATLVMLLVTGNTVSKSELPLITHANYLNENGALDLTTSLQREMDALHSENRQAVKKLLIDIQTLRSITRTVMQSLNKMKSSLQNLNEASQNNPINEALIRKKIRDELATYDADKLGIPDYAQESSGGTIVATPDTQDYETDIWISLWNINLFRLEVNSPRRIIQASKQSVS